MARMLIALAVAVLAVLAVAVVITPLVGAVGDGLSQIVDAAAFAEVMPAADGP